MHDHLIRPGTLDEAVRDAQARWSVPGIAVGVLRDCAVVTRGYGVASLETGFPVRPDTLFQIGSISKVFTATLVMQLVDEGKLSLDTPVVQYLPELRLADDEAQRSITLRHLLSHTSGLEGDRFDDYGDGDDALARAIAEFHSLRQYTRPGELWTYCNSGFYLTGRVIEKVLDQPFETAMRERIFQRLGLTRSFFFAREAIAYPVAVGHTQVTPTSDEHKVARVYSLPRCVNAAGGIIATVSDLLRFAAFHMGDGTVGGERVLSQESLLAMQQPQTQAANFAQAYGLGWALDWVDHVAVVSHGGSTNGFQAQLALVPEKRFAIAILTNGDRGAAAHRDIQRWALAHELGLRVSDPDRVSLAPAALAEFAGHYRLQHGSATLRVEDGQLWLDLRMKSPVTGEEEQRPRIGLVPIGEREFLVTDGDLQGTRIDVILGDHGRPRFLRLGGRLGDYVEEDV